MVFIYVQYELLQNKMCDLQLIQTQPIFITVTDVDGKRVIFPLKKMKKIKRVSIINEKR